MGSGSSISGISSVSTVELKRLPDSIEESIYVFEKFPLVLDPTGQAGRFLKYQLGSFFVLNDFPIDKNALNRALVGALQHGRTLTVKIERTNTEFVEKQLFDDENFPKEILDRKFVMTDEFLRKILKPALGDPNIDEFTVSPDFIFIICLGATEATIPPDLFHVMHPIQVEDKQGRAEVDASNGLTDIESLYGAGEVIRNSTQLVEAAFDGDLVEIKSWIDKGYHIESADGRKHTALSEAAAQGHLEIAVFLLNKGADPNARSDTGN